MSTDITDALVSAMARRCGLENPVSFAAKGGVWAGTPTPEQAECRWGIEVEQHERDPLYGTGRTTRMLLTALVASEIGCAVLIEAEDPRAAGLISSALTMLITKAGSTWRWRGAIVFTWPGNPNAPVWTPDVYLVDHRVGEPHGSRNV